ncbi:MAG: DNA-directed RNA polymerase subunit omega [Candidatus Omnitrophica bacterium]|nr:DNA-directed RNA polymerase subunit omega [Candidatus Omnitrophota bacterium]MBU1932528.1 DNA-directed RNA polymerase subunit omega [Candidatus Omnitrophota bacterium]
MSYMPREKVLKNGDSIFKITLLAAKRAVELNDGAQKLVKTVSTKFSSIALEEIAQGKVKYKIVEQK